MFVFSIGHHTGLNKTPNGGREGFCLPLIGWRLHQSNSVQEKSKATTGYILTKSRNALALSIVFFGYFYQYAIEVDQTEQNLRWVGP